MGSPFSFLNMGSPFAWLNMGNKINIFKKNNDIDSDELATQVHALPPELYNTIFDEVFTVEEGNTAIIDKKYKPPIQLQVNSPNRALYASSYYANTTFTFHEHDVELFSKFLSSLTRSHRLAIRRIHMLRCSASKRSDRLLPSTSGASALAEMRMKLVCTETNKSKKARYREDGENYMRLDPDTVFSTDVILKDDAGNVEEREVEEGFWP